MSRHFTPDDLLACYRRGVFPMAESARSRPLFLVDPEERGVLPLEAFHVPRRLARTVRKDPFEVRIDTAFTDVIEGCAEPAPGRANTWINPAIVRLYAALFERGFAHSVECWRNGTLAGGLYGVALGGAFFGESMFSRATDASKVALVHLCARLRVGGYRLLDAQFWTEHLAQFGAQAIQRAAFRQRLDEALAVEGDFFRLPTGLSGAQLLQSMAQTS